MMVPNFVKLNAFYNSYILMYVAFINLYLILIFKKKIKIKIKIIKKKKKNKKIK